MARQTRSGKAFEYVLGSGFASLFGGNITPSPEEERGKRAFHDHSCKEQESMRQSADRAVTFLLNHDHYLKELESVFLCSDKKGELGDSRDIILRAKRGEIGVSVKQRHHATKHSRISEYIDFGDKWAGCPNSHRYKDAITPVFADLRRKKEVGVFFRDIPDEKNRFYDTVLFVEGGAVA